MKPLDEAEVRAALEDPYWPRRFCSSKREEAAHSMGMDFLRRAASAHGEDPSAVVEGVQADAPLARTVRAILRILPNRPLRGGRPSKMEDRSREYHAIERLRAEGLKGDALFTEALAQLPGCKLSVESLRRNYQRTKKWVTLPPELKALCIVVEVTEPK